MIRTTIKSFIQADLESVWHSVTSLYDYSWRSDIKDIEVSDERHFREISNEGYVTCFTVTVIEPFLKYSFLMHNVKLFRGVDGIFQTGWKWIGSVFYRVN